MVNPFTLEKKISRIQQEVLRPLYSMHTGQERADHDWLLVETGRVIAAHKSFIEELCRSRLIAAIFKIVKFLGGADQLTEDDFKRFTAYVNDGGITAMVNMLLSPDKEKAFRSELMLLPDHVQKNAPRMLEKSRKLHSDFIHSYLNEHYGSSKNIPTKLLENFSKSDDFIARLLFLAKQNLAR